MLIAAEIIAWLIAVPPAIALAIYALELIVGLPRGRKAPPQGGAARSVTILIPAHNEAAGIADTVAGLRRSIPADAAILVVADNCSDDTADRARRAGADVAERFDSERRGKGYALAFGRDWLAADPPATVIVVDADCELAPGSVEQLCAATAGGTPAQAINLLLPDIRAPALVQISSFALLVKNRIRSRGMSRIGGSALLTGTGMAFPWPVFAMAELASGDIAEDLGLGIALTRQGMTTRLVNEAQVRSRAASLKDSTAQRRRWEHGFLANALRHAVPTLGAGLRRGSRPMIAMAMHLMVPPLALLFLISGACLIALAAIGLAWGVWPPFVLLASALIAATGLTVLAWFFHGRETLTARALLQAPLYVAWKIPTYLRFLYAREAQWKRARRKGDAG